MSEPQRVPNDDDLRVAAYLTRNVEDALPAEALAAQLARARETGEPLRCKLGLDPTAPDIHLGHTVVLQKLRELQDAGHLVVLLIGDMTARVGDPSGRDSTRPVLDDTAIDANAATYQEQAFKVLDPARVEVRRNSEWLDMSSADLFGLLRTTTVAQLLERDDFSKRFAAGRPITVLELLYPIMQAYDSVALEADIELGGTDQKFNLLLGRDMQRTYGQRQQSILTMPILPGLDGERKMSKSLGNQVGVRDAPDEMYGKLLSIPDAAMPQYYDLLLGEPMPEGVSPRDAKHALAHRIVERFHDAAAAAAASASFERVFVAKEIPDDIPVVEIPAGEAHLPAVLGAAFGESRSSARRLLSQGAVKCDGDVLPGEPLDVPAADLDGRVIQLGKRRFARLRVGS
ncbi:MAG: tyrosine--tRNA ligase [Solirubrobacteraceae bacterium]|nr:tyrosine--tRNA ligase [Solirubrobacteraceae bacterium]